MIDPSPQAMKNLKLKRYLGDAVTAGFDGSQIWIWVEEPGDTPGIALEYGTLTALIHYASDVRTLTKNVGLKAMELEQI
jgi:hypothetical protein